MCLHFQTLDIYVFDDADPEPTNYIGKAAISLVSLSQGKPIIGQFQLFNVSFYIEFFFIHAEENLYVLRVKCFVNNLHRTSQCVYLHDWS